MALGRRSSVPTPPEPVAPVRAEAFEPEVDKYADKPYVSPSIAAARRGERVNFGTDVLIKDDSTDS